MSRRPSVRAAVVTLASLTAVALATACGAPPDTESTAKGNEAVTAPIRIHWCLAPTDPIWNESGPPDPNEHFSCGCYDVPVPTSLQGIGCTQGVALSGYNCDGTLWSGWVWACPGEALRIAADAVANHSFGGQLPWYEDVVGQGPYDNTCYGTPDGYYVMVSESTSQFLGCSPSACKGTACANGQ
jgi:hypothetical protein